MKRFIIALALVAAFAVPAVAQSPSPSPSPTDSGLKVAVTGGLVKTLTGTTDTAGSTKPTAWVDAKMGMGKYEPFARVGMSGEPGQTSVDPVNVSNVQAVEVGFGVRRSFFDYGKAHLALVVEVGGSNSPDALDNLNKYAFAGVYFHNDDGGEITAGYGYDSLGGDLGLGKLTFYGDLPIKQTADVLILNGQILASLGSRTPAVGGPPVVLHNIFQIGVSADLTRAKELIFHETPKPASTDPGPAPNPSPAPTAPSN